MRIGTSSLKTLACTCAVLILIFDLQTGLAQMIYNPNDERFKSLYLQKVQTDYKVQLGEFDRQKKLHDKGLISEKEFAESEANFKNAQITYQQAILSLAFERPHITIDKAVKYQSKNGRKGVRLTLKNTTSGLMEGKQINLEDFGGIHTDQISNVYVSLLNEQHAIISRPYEAKISSMPYGHRVTVDFFLLQDLDNVTVKCIYGDKSEEKTIFLQKDESANKVLITSGEFSQETDLGSRANYDLTLELFSSMENIYKLDVFNLPPQIAYDFFEAQTNTRFSQVKFSQDINTRKLALAVYIPDRSDSTTLQVDRPLSFFAAAVPQAQAGNVGDKGIKYTEAELEKMNVSFVRLELVPRGVGHIQVRATNFYQELKLGEQVRMDLNVYNDGTRRLDNIKVQVDAPLSWTSVVSPDIVSTLAPGKEEEIFVVVTPPGGVNVGEYEATVKTESFASNRKVESEDKKIRIHIVSNSDIFGTGILVLLLVGVIVGVVVFGVRLGRK